MLLFALPLVVQVWLLAHAPLPALDSVGFVAMAQAMVRDGVLTTVRIDPSPPLFPMLVALVHELLTRLHCIDADDWLLAVQTTAALPLLAVGPLAYRLFRHSVDEFAALGGAVLTSVVAVIARLGADGLSDSCSLCGVLLAIVLMAEFLASLNAGQPLRTWQRLLPAGVTLGVSLMCRAEANVIVLTFLVSLALQWRWHRRLARGDWARASAALLLGVGLVVGPFLVVVGALRPAEIVERLTGRRGPGGEHVPLNASAAEAAWAQQTAIRPQWRRADGQPMVFGRRDEASTARTHGLGWAVYALLRELSQSLHYVLGLLAVVGLWIRRRTLNRPIDSLIWTLCLLYAIAAPLVAWQRGYLASRHLLPIVVLALDWAVVGLCETTDWCLAQIAKLRGRLPAAGQTRFAQLATLGLLVTGVFTSTLMPRHATRSSHHRAATWLASGNAHAGAVLDTSGLTGLSTGRKTYRNRATTVALGDPGLAYVVVEFGEWIAESPRGQTLRELLERFAQPVGQFAHEKSTANEHAVLVYEWDAARFADFRAAQPQGEQRVSAIRTSAGLD